MNHRMTREERSDPALDSKLRQLKSVSRSFKEIRDSVNSNNQEEQQSSLVQGLQRNLNNISMALRLEKENNLKLRVALAIANAARKIEVPAPDEKIVLFQNLRQETDKATYLKSQLDESKFQLQELGLLIAKFDINRNKQSNEVTELRISHDKLTSENFHLKSQVLELKGTLLEKNTQEKMAQVQSRATSTGEITALGMRLEQATEERDIAIHQVQSIRKSQWESISSHRDEVSTLQEQMECQKLVIVQLQKDNELIKREKMDEIEMLRNAKNKMHNEIHVLMVGKENLLKTESLEAELETSKLKTSILEKSLLDMNNTIFENVKTEKTAKKQLEHTNEQLQLLQMELENSNQRLLVCNTALKNTQDDYKKYQLNMEMKYVLQEDAILKMRQKQDLPSFKTWFQNFRKSMGEYISKLETNQAVCLICTNVLASPVICIQCSLNCCLKCCIDILNYKCSRCQQGFVRSTEIGGLSSNKWLHNSVLNEVAYNHHEQLSNMKSLLKNVKLV